MEKRYLTIKETAHECQVHQRTVERWIAEGRMEAVRVNPTGRIRIAADEVERVTRPRSL